VQDSKVSAHDKTALPHAVAKSKFSQYLHQILKHSWRF